MLTSRLIGVVTTSRSDYSILRPVLVGILQRPDLRLHLIVSGSHLSLTHGRTITQIEADSIPIADRVEMLLDSDTPEAISMSLGLGIIGFARSFAHCAPDVLLVVGDRFEMLAATIAATPFHIPVAHLQGGDLTEGAIDDVCRHAMTTLSHVHFVALEEHAARVRQMGAEAWRVMVTGTPALDNLPREQPR